MKRKEKYTSSSSSRTDWTEIEPKIIVTIHRENVLLYLTF